MPVIRNACFAFAISLVGAASAHASSLNVFAISDCSKTQCLTATGAKADVAVSNTSLSARDVKLEVRDVIESQTKRAYKCDRFRYDFVTQFVMCDNRDLHLQSVTVNREFVVTKYP